MSEHDIDRRLRTARGTPLRRDSNRDPEASAAFKGIRSSMDLARVLAQTDAGTRSRAIERLQHGAGNGFVQRAFRSVGAARDGAEPELGEAIAGEVGGGVPLAPKLRSGFEELWDADLGDPRIHTDENADRLAREADAVAFTTGQDVFFRNGLYDPDSTEGFHLLAHELAHVVQHAGTGEDSSLNSRDVTISDPSDTSERSARHAADAALAGRPAHVGGSATATVARQGEADWPPWLFPNPNQHGAPTRPVPPDPHVQELPNRPTTPPDQGPYRTPGQPGGGGAEEAEGLEGAAEAEELDALAEAGAGETLAEGGAAALGAEAILPVAAAGLAGWETGRYLEANTSVGEHAQGTLGAVDEMLSGGPGRPSWMLQTSERMSENWDQGNYLSAIGEGAELGGAGLVGALGGIGGGIVDAGEAVMDWF